MLKTNASFQLHPALQSWYIFIERCWNIMNSTSFIIVCATNTQAVVFYIVYGVTHLIDVGHWMVHSSNLVVIRGRESFLNIKKPFQSNRHMSCLAARQGCAVLWPSLSMFMGLCGDVAVNKKEHQLWPLVVDCTVLQIKQWVESLGAFTSDLLILHTEWVLAVQIFCTSRGQLKPQRIFFSSNR